MRQATTLPTVVTFPPTASLRSLEIPQALTGNCTFGESSTLSETLKPGFSDEELSQTFFDEATALYYYGYRYYNPELGRWINRDPIGERGGGLRGQTLKVKSLVDRGVECEMMGVWQGSSGYSMRVRYTT